MNHQSIQQIIRDFSKQRLLIIGDIMLDQFIYGKVSRISPEAPVPVLSEATQKIMVGGAGNVAANIVSLGGKAHVIAAVGDDNAAKEVHQCLDSLGVSSDLQIDKTRPTIKKTRFIAQAQQLLRLDEEQTHPIDISMEANILQAAKEQLVNCDCMILSDYAKGVLTKNLVPQLIALAKSMDKPVFIDPKGSDWSHYRGATLLSPNLKEAYEITQQYACDDASAAEVAQLLRSKYALSYLLLTRSEKGMSLASEGNTQHIHTQAREIADVSGAGDTVIASLSLALCAGAEMAAALHIATIAAAIVVEKLGTARVQTSELLSRIEETIHPYHDGEKTLAELLDRVESWRRRGFNIGFTNGCFDLLHAGHLHTFIEAKKHCDRLIVAVNSDSSIKRLKGQNRPIQPLQNRIKMLAHLREIDAVIDFCEDTPLALIEAIKPDMLFKGGDYQAEDIVGYDVVTQRGGKVVTIPLVEGISTTNTIKAINKQTKHDD